MDSLSRGADPGDPEANLVDESCFPVSFDPVVDVEVPVLNNEDPGDEIRENVLCCKSDSEAESSDEEGRTAQERAEGCCPRPDSDCTEKNAGSQGSFDRLFQRGVETPLNEYLANDRFEYESAGQVENDGDDQELAKQYADDKPTEWFDILYSEGADGETAIPWADREPNPNLVEWLDTSTLSPAGQRALKVGCGLGDDVEELSSRGFDVTGVVLSDDSGLNSNGLEYSNYE